MIRSNFRIAVLAIVLIGHGHDFLKDIAGLDHDKVARELG